MPRALALLRALRPEQWLKNGFVLAPLVFSGLIGDLDAWVRTLLALAGFCAAASFTYIVNDVLDREADRAHPEKRNRPIASGALPVPLAWTAALGLLVLAAAASAPLENGFRLILLAYLGLTTLYSVVLKHLVFVDVMVVAAGFVLRVVGGAAAIPVPVSRWILLCAFLLALYLALGKRRVELGLLGEEAGNHRKVLGEYSAGLVDQAISVVLGATVVAYSLYTVADDTVAKVGSEGLMITVPMVLYGLLRYLYLLHRTSCGSPGRALVTDRPLLVCVTLWLMVSALVIAVGGGR
jgi:4-hydroxybenzoate polyprenyltransferase